MAGRRPQLGLSLLWLRDAAFAVSALLNAGYKAEAAAWRDWLLRAVAGTPKHLQIMYRVDGARELNESTASWLSIAGQVRCGSARAQGGKTAAREAFERLLEVRNDVRPAVRGI